MGAFLAWFTTVVLVLSFVLVLHQIGFDVTPMVGTAVRGLEHLLGTPL
jgi:uncharacterized membrane protein YidH (DUF202 family)